MCKSRSSSDALPSQRAPSSSAKRRLAAAAAASSSSPSTSYSGGPSGEGTGTASAQHRATSSSSASSASSSRASLAAARASLPDPPILYPFQELAAATNSFLAKRVGNSSSAYWRCSLRGRDAALFQLQLRPDATGALDAAALARIGRYHHTSLARLLGACPAGAHVYLAYELPPGAATLAACLRGTRNPSFTALHTWVSRVQVAADVAQGLEYVHHHADAVHGRVSPSAVFVSDPGLRARLTHFGASKFAAAADTRETGDSPYAAPDSSEPSREADVYAFGVLLLELLSGEEPTRYRFDRGTKEFLRVSILETAAAAVAGGAVRNWVDRRLGDSFPVAAAERLVEVGLRCAAAEDRPEMTWVAGKVSKVYLESRAWEQKLRVPTEFSVSVAPR
ncbi:chitin elicitor receptor kinase 1-like [Phragmites australis]|uniref:chitin elicitor receptor kinase 1-like n=1 Tax=Phragmites australis TaxID=29695 RepID=UPI002D792DDF|nr:chitin elicitor receptor kinase 1-like [Phragmites australis]